MKSYPYISIDLNGSIGEQLFQIAELCIFKKKSKIKRKILIKSDGNKFLNTIFKNAFKTCLNDKYISIDFLSISSNYKDYYSNNNNIKLLEYNRNFNNDIKEKLTYIVYKNKEFYINALKIFNKEKLVIFSKEHIDYDAIFSKDKYDIYCVNNIDNETEFILYSMFKYNLISESLNLLWSSYISHYDNKKIVAHSNFKNISNDFITHYL
jgi:hypothetical protein